MKITGSVSVQPKQQRLDLVDRSQKKSQGSLPDGETPEQTEPSPSPFLYKTINLPLRCDKRIIADMATTTVMVMPGDEISPDLLPSGNSSKTLTLGPGLRHIPPSTITAIRAGELCTDSRKNALWIESTGGRYLPSIGDLVVASVHHSSMDTYHCALTPHTPYALLGQLDFEGATKKTRPVLNSGALIYGRVRKADKWSDVEIECFNPATGKSDGMGPLKGGMLFDVSIGLARRLMMGGGKGGVVVLEDFGEKIRFEIAIGRNGKVWVNAATIKETLAIGKTLMETDAKGLAIDDQKKLVKKVLKDV